MAKILNNLGPSDSKNLKLKITTNTGESELIKGVDNQDFCDGSMITITKNGGGKIYDIDWPKKFYVVASAGKIKLNDFNPEDFNADQEGKAEKLSILFPEDDYDGFESISFKISYFDSARKTKKNNQRALGRILIRDDETITIGDDGDGG
jgi:hypothetical protein